MICTIQPYFIRNESGFNNLKLSIICFSLIFFFIVILDWNMTDDERSLRARANTFYSRYSKSTKGANPFNPLITAQRLDKHYRYNPLDSIGNSYTIQKNIFQMWREAPGHPDFPHRTFHEMFKNNNPEFEYTFLTDFDIPELFKQEFKDTVPEIIETLELLPSSILKADFARYVIIYLFGGSYGDLDVKPELSMNQWFDTNRNVGFVCGTELDVNDKDGWSIIPRRQQIEQWFFKSKAKHPILRNLISTIVMHTFEAREKGIEAYYGKTKGINECKSFDIMEWTGPALFTDIIYAYMNSLKNTVIVDTNVSRTNYGRTLYGPDVPQGVGINWKTTTGTDWPMIIGDVVLYPQHTLRDPPLDDGRDFYARHYFSGSWKPFMENPLLND